MFYLSLCHHSDLVLVNVLYHVGAAPLEVVEGVLVGTGVALEVFPSPPPLRGILRAGFFHRRARSAKTKEAEGTLSCYSKQCGNDPRRNLKTLV